ncbi:hypothetical protein PIB30_035243 [Stylosanthes scabra]|uniref:Uncharacterized protein n=1 Tax=Stylosanthes scabra TaxID=79078 RepID=A0ABU6UGD0_9FABA|nr:hypothetical protein [Stylosanthes scabra]
MLPSLSELYLVDCHLNNMSPSLQFANFTALEVLDLSVDAIHSEVPNWIFNLTSEISYIYLENNLLRDQLPKAMPNFQVLRSLGLSNNYLDGPIPDWLVKLEHLGYLDFSSNLFSGPLPINLGNLTSLVVLYASSNLFTGVVSEKHFSNLSNLKFLSVDSPNIIFDFDLHWIPPFQLDSVYLGPVGPKLPQWLYTQTSLKSLGFVNSKISFEAGDKFWSFDPWFPFCVITRREAICSTWTCPTTNYPGGLTDCWTNWKSLLHINLGKNDLSGKIPPSMGLLANLTSLHLHQNNLSGVIPLSLQNCHSLLVLNVRENRFSGSIPNWLPHKAKALHAFPHYLGFCR